MPLEEKVVVKDQNRDVTIYTNSLLVSFIWL